MEYQMQSFVCYFHHAFLGFFHLLQIHSLCCTICSLSFRINSLHKFPLHDLQRLKDKMAWLSDTHIDFALQCVLFPSCYHWLHIWIKQRFFPPMPPPPEWNLLLLPCGFWTQLSQYPEKFTAKYWSRTNLLKYDFIVMPMHGRKLHWLIEVA